MAFETVTNPMWIVAEAAHHVAMVRCVQKAQTVKAACAQVEPAKLHSVPTEFKTAWKPEWTVVAAPVLHAPMVAAAQMEPTVNLVCAPTACVSQQRAPMVSEMVTKQMSIAAEVAEIAQMARCAAMLTIVPAACAPMEPAWHQPVTTESKTVMKKALIAAEAATTNALARNQAAASLVALSVLHQQRAHHRPSSGSSSDSCSSAHVDGDKPDIACGTLFPGRFFFSTYSW